MPQQQQHQQRPVVLITGSSIGGIGHSLALSFARRHCTVVASSRSLSSMAGLDSFPGIRLLQLDVSSLPSILRGVASVLAEHGRIDILVNNAGVHCVAPVAELPLSLLESTFRTNVYGAISLIQAVVPDMITRRKGKIVNIGSVTAFAAGPWVGGYSASKAALHSLSDSLRVELKPFGIDVVTVAPCAVRSNIGANSSNIYKKNPEWKFYKPWESAIEARTSASQLPKATPTDKFAEKTVHAILRENPPPCFIYGYLWIFYTMLYYLPVSLKDWIMKMYFGVKDLNEAEKTA